MAAFRTEKALFRVYVARDILVRRYADFKRLDRGDIIGVVGNVFKTKTGDIHP